MLTTTGSALTSLGFGVSSSSGDSDRITRFEFLLGSYRGQHPSALLIHSSFDRMPTFPGLSIGSSSSCIDAVAFPLPLAVSDALGMDFDIGAGFEKTLAGGADLTGGLDFATGFCGLDS